MQLSASQITEYERDGFLFFPGLLDSDEVALLQGAMPSILSRSGNEIIREKEDPTSVRLAFGAHSYSEPFRRLSLLPRIVEPMKQLLGEDVYLHQSRMNPKQGFGSGQSWAWHQDYSAWNVVDGMPEPRCVMVAVFIDDCTTAKSPLLVIPGSHRDGFLNDVELHQDADGYSLYQLDQETFVRLADEYGIEPLVGPAGSVCFCHSIVVHGSANNVSPWRRAIMYLIYNAVSNACTNGDRPWFQNNRDFTPLTAIDDEDLRRLT